MSKIQLTDSDMEDIYDSYQHWVDNREIKKYEIKVFYEEGQEEDWWAGHGYDGEFNFDINFVLGYESDDLGDTNDFGVWVYPVSPPDYQIPLTGIDVTDEFKAWKGKTKKEGV